MVKCVKAATAESAATSRNARSTTDTTTHGAATSTALLTVLQGHPQQGHVLGSSAAGLYLHFEDVLDAPNVVALLPTSSVRLPLAMVSAAPLPTVSLDSHIEIGDGWLRVGPHGWHTLRWFQPRPRSCRAPHPALLESSASLLRDLDEAQVGVSPTRAWAAATALAAGDPEPCCELLGDGPGLTPAGDDVVAGALAACTLAGTSPSRAAIQELLDRARVATTTLSTALLRCAAAGQVVPQAANFLRALTGAVPLVPALGQLRAVGSTSGTALAIGLVAASAAARLEHLADLAVLPAPSA